MEQVLRGSDDGILVYICPTKALVTQVAAEVYARFSKDLDGSKSIPSIIVHTILMFASRKLLGNSHERPPRSRPSKVPNIDNGSGNLVYNDALSGAIPLLE